MFGQREVYIFKNRELQINKLKVGSIPTRNQDSFFGIRFIWLVVQIILFSLSMGWKR